MKIFLILCIALCACASEMQETKTADRDKDKRQTLEGVPSTLQYVYRQARKQEHITPVEEPQEDDKSHLSGSSSEEYRPGQVFSLNAQELLELQPERKAPYSGSQQLQHSYEQQPERKQSYGLYDQAEHKQNLQQFYYIEPQSAQVAIQPSHAVITRPHYSSNGGEASVGAALSVSDSSSGSSDSFDQELLALLSQTSPRPEEQRPQTYAQTASAPQSASQSVAPQYQQIDRYITKPSKKPTKLRPKVAQIIPAQIAAAPQQYLIETTNVQQAQEPQQQQVQYQQVQPQYRVVQPQRPAQSLRYAAIAPASQPNYYEPQGIKVVAAPKLQTARVPLAYSFVPPVYQSSAPAVQQQATPKQYRIVEAPRPQPSRQEPKILQSSIERPVTYLKRFPEPEKLRAIKLYEQISPESLAAAQPTQLSAEQYYVRPSHRQSNEPRLAMSRYEYPAISSMEQPRVIESAKPPHSSIYVSKNVAPKKVVRPQPQEVSLRDYTYRLEQPAMRLEQVRIEQHGQNLEEQRAHLPPPKNNKAYTPEEFAALVAAGYSVTPIPVTQGSHVAQAKSAIEPTPIYPQRRPAIRRNQYLPLRSDDAP